MSIKILILEKGDLYREQLMNLLRSRLKTIDISFVLVSDVAAFFPKLREESFNLIFINFDVPSISAMSIPNLESFINETKAILQSNCKVAAFTGCSQLSKKLFHLGILSRTKEYNQKGLDDIISPFIKRVRAPKSQPAKIVAILSEEVITYAELIQQAVCDEFGIPIEKIKLPKGKKEVNEAKYASMYLVKRFTPLSLKDIGTCIGARHHTSIIHGVQTAEDLLETNPLFRLKVHDLIEKIKSFKSPFI